MERIVSLLLGGALVASGVYLLTAESQHSEALWMGAALITGGLGTLGLRGIRPPRSGPPLPVLMFLAFVFAAGAAGCAGGTGGVAGAIITAVPKVRDLTCGGARIVCQWMDRACRATGGPAVLPEHEHAEPESDTGGGEDPPPLEP